MSKTIKDIGEQGLLNIVQEFCPKNIIGDDGAIIPTDPHKLLVITTDMLVENVHFSHQTTSNYDIGWRAVGANLSDLAAMGAYPLGLTVALALPSNVTIKSIKELYKGLSQCGEKYNCPIMGGDLCKSSMITVSITALGEVLPHQTIRRFTAKKGDYIVVTGIHGGAKGGLELLLNPSLQTCLNPTEKNELIKYHQQPQPRLDVIPFLWENNPSITVSGMDSSDGLADAIVQICRCSEVGAQINTDLIPIPHSLKKMVGETQALDWALYGGEDFELVLCLPPQNAENLVHKLGGNSAIIGEITQHKEIQLIDDKGLLSSQSLTREKGFQHF
jgi:thiamine-monophosphate kinase